MVFFCDRKNRNFKGLKDRHRKSFINLRKREGERAQLIDAPEIKQDY